MGFFDKLFPASAGVILGYKARNLQMATVPRIRGGDPCSHVVIIINVTCSPHPRG